MDWQAIHVARPDERKKVARKTRTLLPLTDDAVRNHLTGKQTIGIYPLLPDEEAACWAHVRRKFYDLREAHKSPVAAEALERIGALYTIETAGPLVRQIRPMRCQRNARMSWAARAIGPTTSGRIDNRSESG